MKIRINRKVIRAAAAVLAVLTLSLMGALLRSLWDEGGSRRTDGPAGEPENEGELILFEDTWYAPREDLETILVLGLDRSEQDGISTTGDYAQSDLLLLLELDRMAGTYKVIHLNRDTMAEIQDFDDYGRPKGSYTAQLALAYAHAQAYTGNDKIASWAAMDAVSGLLYGVEIDHYISLTMDGVIALNDLVGGVEVEIRDDFSAVDPTLVQGERVTLMGRHALNYVRARWYVGDSTNLERMERQQTYLLALLDKVSAMAGEDSDAMMSALMEVNEHMDSDYTAEQLTELLETMAGFRMERASALAVEAVEVDNMVEFRVDEEALRRLVVEDFYEPAEAPNE